MRRRRNGRGGRAGEERNVVAQTLKLGPPLLQQRLHLAFLRFAVSNGVNGDVRQRWNSHVFAALAVDAAAIQQRPHVLLVQPVRFIYILFSELHAQVPAAIHCVHERVRLPPDTAHTAQLHKKTVGGSTQGVACRQRVQRGGTATLETQGGGKMFVDAFHVVGCLCVFGASFGLADTVRHETRAFHAREQGALRRRQRRVASQKQHTQRMLHKQSTTRLFTTSASAL